jgi:crotonobetainyl-CoA:carnitine CoA-transferase CaiB-like acyl-CoA transferase
MNRNKRSIAVDLKLDEGREIALDIIADADILIENFRPGVMDRLGLGYEDARAVNENIIYVDASGFGSDGPYKDRPGQDLLIQGMSGIASYTGRRDDPPTPAGTAVVDEHSATLIAFNTMIALFHRERTGKGQKVEANLMNAAIDMQCQEITAILNMDEKFERSESGIAAAWLGAPYGIYETEDDYVAIAMSPLEPLAEIFDRDDLTTYETTRETYRNRDELKRKIEAETRTWETESLLNALLEKDIWAARVNDFHEMAADPQVQHNEMIVEMDHPDGGTFETTGIPVTMSETPGSIRSRPPTAGEHTDEILENLGYDMEKRTTLHDAGVVE